MGGLVVRAFLQNRDARRATKRARTRRQGLHLRHAAQRHRLLGMNVPSWLGAERHEQLQPQAHGGVPRPRRTSTSKYGPRRLPARERASRSQRIFCMVGTNRSDYEAGQGPVAHLRRQRQRRPGAHRERLGLGCRRRRRGHQRQRPRPTAYRSHSGFFGLVNSEEALPEPDTLPVRRRARRHLARHRRACALPPEHRRQAGRGAVPVRTAGRARAASAGT